MSDKETSPCYHPSIVPMHLQIQSVSFLAVVFTYQGSLLLFGIFTFSKYIVMSVYNVFVLSIIGAVVSLTLEGSAYYDASFMRLIMSTSLTMLSVFAPKVRIFCLETYLLHM